ncbi:hypothetical protein [Brachybacterium sp. AOP3-A1-3]|uniref:hypothetical protein n=1 Tax=Brachybacterium sp. AOP3-A1-3 TaxID=3457699 RepID=UPI0040347726
MSPFWQIITSAGLGALITAFSSFAIVHIGNRHARQQAIEAREHDKEMRALEYERADAQELAGIIHELAVVTERWANAQLVTIPLVDQMEREDLMEWVDTDSARESREMAVRISDRLIRALLLTRDQTMQRKVSAALKARDALQEASGLDGKFAALGAFRSAVNDIAVHETNSRK